jgi:hypothetical protein
LLKDKVENKVFKDLKIKLYFWIASGFALAMTCCGEAFEARKRTTDAVIPAKAGIPRKNKQGSV